MKCIRRGKPKKVILLRFLPGPIPLLLYFSPWILGLTFFTLVGCSVGPDYKPPKIEVPQNWKWGEQKPDPKDSHSREKPQIEEKKIAKGGNDLQVEENIKRAIEEARKNPGKWKLAAPKDFVKKGQWWKIFNDPVLDQLEAEAEVANQQIKMAMANVIEARAGVGAALSAFFPHTNFTPSYQRWKLKTHLPWLPFILPEPIFSTVPLLGQNGVIIPSGSIIGSTQYYGFQPTLNIWQVYLNSNWELDIWGKLRRQLEAAKAEAQASQAELEGMKLTIHADVAQAYYLLRYIDSQLEVMEQMIHVYEDNLKRVEIRFKSGLSNELDLARAKTDLSRIKAQYIALESHRAKVENSIARLLGQPASTFHFPRKPLKEEPPDVPQSLPSDILEQRPDIAQAEREMAATNAMIGVAYAAYFPSVNLNAYFGFFNTDFGQLFTWPSNSWIYGPLIDLPIFEGGRLLANLMQARAAYEKAVASYRETILTAFEEVENALIGMRLLEEEQKVEDEVVASAKKQYDLALDRFQRGLSHYIEVDTTESVWLNAILTDIALRGERFIVRIALIRAFGGGWADSSMKKPSFQQNQSKN
ncbi:efflux transporter outer membrane subunit [Candidatus Methylacidiphilum infernorum]|uniref:Efflux transporter outer membrane subunit n=1 Tax=Candidatus Methylacidiphilum infernorum TaxID=511746 RepID=A0ABX7PYB3_9BACT|nr:efflux transporter outer membrane subunit [Candidatus Methylacidiphilum infernorum]QSR87551.1 efflux transporter outer membrane subunit [Candidatus Methylacidiphilum infernorum]